MLFLEIFFIACILFAAISIFLSTMKTGISPSPSSGKVARVIVRAVEESGSGPIIDLGSGWGTIVVALARAYPEREVIGYELSFIPWLFTSIRKQVSGLDNLTLFRTNFLEADLSEASSLTCYLYPGGMSSLQEKVEKDNIKDILLVSNTFALPDRVPENVVRVKDMYQTPVYMYRL